MFASRNVCWLVTRELGEYGRYEVLGQSLGEADAIRHPLY